MGFLDIFRKRVSSKAILRAPLASKRTQLAVDDGKKDQKDTSEGKLYTNNSSTNF